MESKTREGNRTRGPPPEVAFEWGVFQFLSLSSPQ